MRIKKVKLRNIRSYTNASIEFPTGSVLLAGDIGTGKSSILYAIEFALFGLQKGEIDGASLLRHGQSSGSVELHLDINGKDVIIMRTLKRTKSSVAQDSGSIVIDGSKASLSATELKARVFELLNYPKQYLNKKSLIYRFTVYTPQEEMKRIIQDKAETRIEVLRKLFDIEKYNRIKENAKILHDFLKNVIKEKQGFTADIDEKLQRLKQIDQQMTQYKQQAEQLSSEIERVKQQKQALQANIEQLEKQYKQLNELVNSYAALSEIIREKQKLKQDYQQELRLYEERKNRAIEEICSITSSIDKDVFHLNLCSNDENCIKLTDAAVSITPRIMQLLTLLEQLNASAEHELNIAHQLREYQLRDHLKLAKEVRDKLEENINTITAKLYSLNTKKRDLEKELNDILNLNKCPKCKQIVPQQHKESIQNEQKQKIEAINKLILSMQQKLDCLKNDKNSIKTYIEAIDNLIHVVDKASLHARAVIDAIKQQQEKREAINKLDKEINELSLKLKDDSKIRQQLANVESELNKLKQLKLEIDARELNLVKQKANVDGIVKSLSDELLAVKLEVKQKQEELEKMRQLKLFDDFLTTEFIKAVDEIEKQVMVTINREFNAFFQRWFNMLIDDDTISVKVDIDFTPIIEQNGYETSYEYLSGGERTALALAYRLALNQTINCLLGNINTKGLIILDEPTDGFSDKQLDKIRDVLQEINAEQLIIVSHEPKIEGFVDNIIRLRKENSETIVE